MPSKVSRQALRTNRFLRPSTFLNLEYTTGADAVEVVSAADDKRLIEEALEAGELFPVGEDCYYSRSYSKDTARSEERTIVATSNESDKGVYNNWRPASQMKPKLTELMTEVGLL